MAAIKNIIKKLTPPIIIEIYQLKKDYELIEKFDAGDSGIGDFAFKGAILKRRS